MVPEVVWRKSSYTSSQDDWGNCVEVGRWNKSSRSEFSGCIETAPGWYKSEHSGHQTDACVEVHPGKGILVRDSKDPDGPRLGFSRREWKEFLQEVKGL